MSAHLVLPALQRLLDAIEDYDDCEPDTVEELDAAEKFARAVVEAVAPAPTQSAFELGVYS